MSRKPRPVLELLANIGVIGFDLQRNYSADEIADAMRLMRLSNARLFDFLARTLGPAMPTNAVASKPKLRKADTSRV